MDYMAARSGAARGLRQLAAACGSLPPLWWGQLAARGGEAWIRGSARKCLDHSTPTSLAPPHPQQAAAPTHRQQAAAVHDTARTRAPFVVHTAASSVSDRRISSNAWITRQSAELLGPLGSVSMTDNIVA